MAIAPGEPVPPGFENEVKAISELQSRIDKCKDEALVGLEYVMELAMGNNQEPNYHCVLCDKRGDPRTIMVHMTSYNHRLKFLVIENNTFANKCMQFLRFRLFIHYEKLFD